MTPGNRLLTPVDWARLQELFDAALGLPPPERPLFLDEACAGQTHLRSRIESLLRSADGATVFEPAVRQALEEATAAAGERIGPYQVIRVLGRGGMGVVYLAARADDQFHKLAAIKLLGVGALDPEMRRRFLLERQILAGLEHPNIARLLDGGTLDGAPYVVMEYVDGPPIDRYCREQCLSVRERLRLFLELAGAVSYAHRNLIVHRDIKPGNVLVSGGAPKLLDFGIAKLVHADGRPKTLALTQMGARLMTPDYASPEQVRGETIATPSDIYSLGVLLYELLTGQRPFRAKGGLPGELERAICTEEPTRPSAVANPRELRGDLDNIILMALSKEPDRRYASVDQFAEDIRRHLEGFPVVARPATWRYRSGKFVRRHKLGVAAAGLVSLLILGFGAGMALLAKRAAAERDTARAERSRAEQVSNLLLDTFRVADPSLGDGSRVTAREILDRASQTIARQTVDPAIRADLLDTLGLVYRNLGVYDRSRQELESARELRRKLFGPGSPQYALSLEHLAELADDTGAWNEAEALLRQTIGLRAGGAMAQARAESLTLLATVLRRLSHYPEAEQEARKALALLRQSSPAASLAVAEAESSLGEILMDQGKNADAEPILREALEWKRKALGEDNIQIADLLDRVGQVRLMSHDYPAAADFFTRSMRLYAKLLGENSRAVGELQNNLGVTYAWAGDVPAAVAMQKQSVATYRKVFGDAHPEILTLLWNETINLHDLGEHAEEASAQREMERIAPQTAGVSQILLLNVKQAGANVRFDRGEFRSAEQGFRDMIEERRRLGASPRFLAGTLAQLGDTLVPQGRIAEAIQIYRTAADQFQGKERETIQAARVYERLGRGLALQHQNAEGRAFLEKSIAVFRAGAGPNLPHLAKALLDLGELEMAEHRPGNGSKFLAESVAIRRKVMPPGAWEIAVAESALARSGGETAGIAKGIPALARCALVSYECREELSRVRGH